MAFTEFYIQSGGSNLNAGSTNSNTALYTSTNGNWNGSTIFTPTDGTNPVTAGVAVGMYAAVHLDAATSTVSVSRITAVQNATNGTITVSSTVRYGTVPTSGATGRTIKVGGAWVGPGGASNFPWAISGNSLGALVNTSNDTVRVNAKNDQTYTMTSALNFSSLSGAVLQGYTSSPGDGGKATFTSNLTSNAFNVSTNNNQAFIDLVFASTAGSGSGHVFTSNVNGVILLRCVFHGGRGAGINATGNNVIVTCIECEAYDNNKSNGSDLGGFTAGAGNVVCVHCYSHDNAGGSNADGYVSGSTGGALIIINSIADTNAGAGANFKGAFNGLVSINSDYYNNTGDAIKFAASNKRMFSVMMNNNFIKNGGGGINNTTTSQSGITYNNGYGSGTQANGSSDTLGSIVDTSTSITYPSNLTPWNAPTTGDFSTTLAEAKGVGRGVFTESDGTNTGTVGYPDIGAAQALVSSKSSHVFCG